MDKEIEALLQKVKDANRTPFWQSTPDAARALSPASSPTLKDADAARAVVCADGGEGGGRKEVGWMSVREGGRFEKRQSRRGREGWTRFQR